ncbi:MAG: 1-(5-phosphoribosyl)-5-[(5-phosphoribosylamino)methylideneamino] imidazole-4-carboxamide isomerase [Candidatus Coatesbacteria bacterium]
MLIFPAIDLLNGLVVRLKRGEYSQTSAYSDDPVRVAKEFKAAGATHLHVVDLDGARTGTPIHLSVVGELADKTGLAIDFGGGLRNRNDIEAALRAGVKTVIIGTAAYRDPDFLRWAVETHADNLAVAVDVKGDRIAEQGWTRMGETGALDALTALARRGVRRIVYTDADRDGTLEGVDVERLGLVMDRAETERLEVVLAGGVRDLDDIRKLKPLSGKGLAGVIAGKALYEGTLDLAEAIRAAK